MIFHEVKLLDLIFLSAVCNAFLKKQFKLKELIQFFYLDGLGVKMQVRNNYIFRKKNYFPVMGDWCYLF